MAPSVEVIGGALAHSGINKRGSGRDTHAPPQFILDLGKAYRETKRQKPIMDAFAFHPYLEHANLPPTYKHYSPRVITIADYGRLVSVLGRAFDGTAQKGSKLPIVYAEFGVESRIPDALLPAYTGTEPATTRPVNESTQAQVLREGDADGRVPADRAHVPRLPPDRRAAPRRLAVGRLLRRTARRRRASSRCRLAARALGGVSARAAVPRCSSREPQGLVLPGAQADPRASRP